MSGLDLVRDSVKLGTVVDSRERISGVAPRDLRAEMLFTWVN